MEFEVNFGGNEVWVMRAAGVEMSAYQELDFQLLTGKLKLPASVTCPYFLSDQQVDVRITILASRHLRIQVPDEEIGKRIQTEILRYTSPSRGVSTSEEEDRALYARIREILEPDGVTPEDVEANRVTLSRRAQQELLALCDETHHAHRGKIYWQFTKSQIPRPDRALLAAELLERFALERDPYTRSDIGTVFLNHRDLALRGLADLGYGFPVRGQPELPD